MSELMMCMEKKVLLDSLYTRLSYELKEYKESILAKTNAEILSCAYQIDCKIRIYEILVECMEGFTIDYLMMLDSIKEILEFFYGEWIHTDDSSTDELQDSINNSLQKYERIGVI